MQNISKKKILAKHGKYIHFYGILNLIKSEYTYQKILWPAYIIFAVACSGYYIHELVKDYFQFNVVTKIETFYEQPTEFPTVSFCSLNNNDFDLINNNDLIAKCVFGIIFNCKNELNDSFEIFYAFYGKCFRFNSGKNLNKQPISIFKSNVGAFEDSLDIKLNYTGDIIFWIHDRFSPPLIEYNNNHDNNRIFATGLSYTLITIDKVIEKKLSEPYNDCLNDVTQFFSNKTIINYILSQDKNYTQLECLKLCFELDYINNNNSCNCTNIKFGNVWNKCYGFNETSAQGSIKNCLLKSKENFYSNEIMQNCKEYCPLECETKSYLTQISSANKFTKNTDNITRIRIYFRTLKHTLITQEPYMKLNYLVSNIGGILGLFIGISFVTLFELAEIIFELGYVCAKKKFAIKRNSIHS